MFLFTLIQRGRLPSKVCHFFKEDQDESYGLLESEILV